MCIRDSFESAEASLALRCGQANALREALDIGLDAIRARIDTVAQALRTELAAIAGIEVLDQGLSLIHSSGGKLVHG